MEAVDYENEQSIIAHLLRMEEIIQNFQDTMRKEQIKIRDCEGYDNDANIKIEEMLDNIKKEVLARLKKIIDECNMNKQKIGADADSYRNDVYLLYDQNLEIQKKIEELQKQIKNMESIIGHDQEFMCYTK
ncbi:MAG: hypothetical protein MJ252_10570 [archaeon]|nr:hypothetical protein [archaeon]